jgi:hypothetical protein
MAATSDFRVPVPGRSRLLVALACGFALGSAAAAPPGDALAPTAGYASCRIEQPLKVQGKIKLQPGCIYSTTVAISQGGSELDCQGSVIDPSGLKGYALTIDSDGKPMRDVTVRNCLIRNAPAIAVLVGWRKPDREKSEGLTHDELYARTPQGVRILNTRIEGAGGAAIYIDDYVSDVLIDAVSVMDTKAVGVYLEHSSKHITIQNSRFENNSTERKREALAIDSSAGNVVRGNYFRGNKAGGIFLYRNCFEHAATDPQQVQRWQSASDNLIEDNVFEDEPIGVWIASRQSRDQRAMECGLPYYDGKYVLDDAPRNTVRGNVFRRVARGVLVEDDDNTVSDNRFSDAAMSCVEIGSKARGGLLHRPVRGTKVSGNRCDGAFVRGADDAVRYRYGSTPR